MLCLFYRILNKLLLKFPVAQVLAFVADFLFIIDTSFFYMYIHN